MSSEETVEISEGTQACLKVLEAEMPVRGTDEERAEMQRLLEEAEKKRPAAAAEAKPSKFKWSTAADTLFKFDHAHAVGGVDLAPFDWSAVTGMERAEKGSEGLFFVQTKAAGAFVVKRSKAIGAELVCALLARRLGLDTPRVRLMPTNSREALDFLAAVKRADPMGSMRTVLFAPSYVLVMQYAARARSANELDYVAARELFGGEGAQMSADGARICEQLGALVALDVLVNNCDRFPLADLWAHRGNPGNVLFDGVRKDVLSIDGQIIALRRASPELAAYLDGVRRVCARRDFLSVRDKLKEWTELDIGDAGVAAVARGFERVRAAVARAPADLVAAVERWRAALARCDPPLPDAAQIDASFIGDVAKCFSEASEVV